MTNPWFKFYPTDWKADDQLKLCSVGARGLWIELLCICHNATPYGHLLVDGKAPTETELSVLIGIPVDQILQLMHELDTRGIFSKTSKGVIYSRKLVRDDKKSKEGKKFGKNGGNPSLCKDSEKESTLKGKDKTGVNTQIPEARKKEEKTPEKASRETDGKYLFEGDVIKLTQKDFDALHSKSGLSKKGFIDFLDEKDRFYATLAEHERANWWWRLTSSINQIAERNA